MSVWEFLARAGAIAALLVAFGWFIHELRGSRQDELDDREADLVLREEALKRSLLELQHKFAARRVLDAEGARMERQMTADRAAWQELEDGHLVQQTADGVRTLRPSNRWGNR